MYIPYSRRSGFEAMQLLDNDIMVNSASSSYAFTSAGNLGVDEAEQSSDRCPCDSA
jgi:hypothetical protein